MTSAPPTAGLPSTVDLSAKIGPPGDQGGESSCVGWAVGYATKTLQETTELGWSPSVQNHQFSPSWIYNQINFGVDQGSYFADAMNLVISGGDDDLAQFPYVDGDYKTQPDSNSRARAARFKAKSWASISVTETDIKNVLAGGNAVITGISVLPDFDALNGSTNDTYDNDSGNSRGYHAIAIIGYDDSRHAFRFINSWGTSWGSQGYGWIAYSFINNAKLDMTTMVMIDGQDAPPVQPSAPISVVTQPLNGTSPGQTDLFALDGNRSLVHGDWTAASGFRWETLGGTFVSPPVAVAGANGPGSVDVFGQGTDYGFYHKAWNGSTWVPAGPTQWDGLDNMAFVAQPAVVSWGRNRIDVFGQGTDTRYYHKAWTGPATGWTPWELVGGQFNGPPVVISRAPGSLDLFGRGTDDRYYHKSYNGSFTPAGPDGWTQVGPGQYFSDPVVAATGSRLDIFGQGYDYHYYHQAGIGAPLEALSGTYMGPPAAAWQSANRLDVVGQGTDSNYYHLQQLNGAWTPLDAVNGSGFGRASLLVPASGDLNVFVEGTDRHVYFKGLRGTTWSGWAAVGSGSLL